jgi:phosphopantothenoylcysteine decarboxylase/phosphopantothenate--cysteine ligase
VGRLADPADILAVIEGTLAEAAGEGYAPRSLDGLRVLVTAGGTREAIDSVRYVGNRSSGRMGFALAEEAARRGAEVTLVAANVSLEKPAGVQVVDVESAAQLHDATLEAFPGSDLLLMAAAVADFRPRETEGSKISKSGRDELALELEPTPDVLSELSLARGPGQTLVGFAAEHGEGGVERGRAKLDRKQLDAVVVNDISRSDIGFDSDHNEVTIVTAAGECAVERGPKSAVAAAILDEVEALRARGTVETSDER